MTRALLVVRPYSCAASLQYYYSAIKSYSLQPEQGTDEHYWKTPMFSHNDLMYSIIGKCICLMKGRGNYMISIGD